MRAVRLCVSSGAGEDKMSLIRRLRCFVVGYSNEYSSRHLLPTSEPLKTQSINFTLVFKEMCRSPICLNASMFAQIILDPTSSTEEVSIRFFYESLQIASLNNVLVSQFRGWSLQSARHRTEERGGVSRAHEHLKQRGLEWLAENRAEFDRAKNEFFTLPLRTFHKDIKESYQLVKNGYSMTPLITFSLEKAVLWTDDLHFLYK